MTKTHTTVRMPESQDAHTLHLSEPRGPGGRILQWCWVTLKEQCVQTLCVVQFVHLKDKIKEYIFGFRGVTEVPDFRVISPSLSG